MDPITITLGALAILEQSWPLVQDAMRKGTVPQEIEEQLKASITSLELRSSGEFKGPQWDKAPVDPVD